MAEKELFELALEKYYKNDFEKAKSLFLEIIDEKIGKDIGNYDREYILEVYHTLLLCCQNTGDDQLMEKWGEIAFKYFISAKHKEDLSYFDFLYALALSKENLGKFKEGEKLLRIGIDKLDGKSEKIVSYNLRYYTTLGDIFGTNGDHLLGVHYYQKAARMASDFEDIKPAFLELLHNNLGSFYLYLRNYDLAIKNFSIALKLLKKRKQPEFRRLIGTEQNLANVYGRKGDFRKAVELFEALLIEHKDKLKNEPQGVAAIHQNLGSCYLKLNDYQNAEKYIVKAYDTRKHDLAGSFSKFNTQNSLSELAQKKGEYEKAISILENAHEELFLSGESKSKKIDYKNFKYPIILCKSFWGELTARLGLLKSEKSKNKKEDWYSFEERFVVVEKVLAEIPREATNSKTRERWKHVSHQILEVVLDFAYEFDNQFGDSHYVNLFFKFFTKFNGSISIYDMKDADVNQSDSLFLELIKQEKNFNRDIKNLNQQIAQSEGNKKITLEEELFKEQEAYRFFLSETKKHFPDFYYLRYQVEELDIDLFQSCLPNESLALFYVWCETKVYLFVVPDNGPVQLHFIGLSEELKEELSNFHKGFNFLVKNKLNKSAKILGESLLKPILDRDRFNQNKLLIFPDGELLKVPFESFRIKRNEQAEEKYLIELFNIQYQVWPQLWMERTLISKNKEKLQIKGSELFFGISPTYSDFPASEVQDLAPQFRSFINKAGEVADLPFSIKEIKELQDLLENNKRKVVLFEYEDANPAFVRSEIHLKQPDIIHFASHGILNKKNPELSGLLLSTVYNKEGNVFDNLKRNILYSNDIYNWKLDAKLVVLSCCDTGVGELVMGEGLMAINKAFLYAGADSVMFSLGKVLDKPTKELMLLFYSFLMEGCETWDALQKAKLKMLKEGKPPKYWASFILV